MAIQKKDQNIVFGVFVFVFMTTVIIVANSLVGSFSKAPTDDQRIDYVPPTTTSTIAPTPTTLNNTTNTTTTPPSTTLPPSTTTCTTKDPFCMPVEDTPL
ncbi:MAG: hypothetical protein ABH950_09995 [Candidatus Altiarchaeota archaeon]